MNFATYRHASMDLAGMANEKLLRWCHQHGRSVDIASPSAFGKYLLCSSLDRNQVAELEQVFPDLLIEPESRRRFRIIAVRVTICFVVLASGVVGWLAFDRDNALFVVSAITSIFLVSIAIFLRLSRRPVFPTVESLFVTKSVQVSSARCDSEIVTVRAQRSLARELGAGVILLTFFSFFAYSWASSNFLLLTVALVGFSVQLARETRHQRPEFELEFDDQYVTVCRYNILTNSKVLVPIDWFEEGESGNTCIVTNLGRVDVPAVTFETVRHKILHPESGLAQPAKQ